ncbi:MAG: hypothetical protein ACXVHX_22805 [Solirubrobacteraceae bacterium]
MSDEGMDFVAALDQARRALTDVAHTLGDYNRDLSRQGFTPEECIVLVRDAQRLIWRGGSE